MTSKKSLFLFPKAQSIMIYLFDPVYRKIKASSVNIYMHFFIHTFNSVQKSDRHTQGRISHLTALTNVRGPGPKGGPWRGGGGARGAEGPWTRPKIAFFSSESVSFERALRAFIIFLTKIFGRAPRALSYLKDKGFLLWMWGPEFLLLIQTNIGTNEQIKH